jgi:limonene-1,2-epoxide hydrolase
MHEDERTIREFMAGWGGESFRKVFDEYLADDCVWLNTGLPPFEGKETCIALLDRFMEAVPQMDVEVLNVASNGDVWFFERKDRCLDHEGQETIVIDVTGVFRLRDGKIVHWHDYFDPTPLYPMLGG